MASSTLSISTELTPKVFELPENTPNAEQPIDILPCEETVIRKYQVKLEEQTTDFFALTNATKRKLLQTLQARFEQIEREKPAAGYSVAIIGSNAGKNPVEGILEAFGTRNPDEPMKMPTQNCVFCPKVGKNDQLVGFEQPLESKTLVIKTLQNNPLIISRAHKGHWFELDIDTQMEMVSTAEKVLNQFEKSPIRNYELHAHIGTEGHQKVPHTHMHTLTGLNIPLGYYA